MENTELIQGLRDLLAFVESNQDFEFNPSPSTFVINAEARTWYFNGEDKQRQFIADLTRRMAHCGKVEKVYGNEFAWIRLNFGPHVKFEINTMREVICERVVVGKKIIPARPPTVIPAAPERTEEEVEWRCHPVMTAGSSVEAPATPKLGDGGTPVLEAEYESLPF